MIAIHAVGAGHLKAGTSEVRVLSDDLVAVQLQFTANGFAQHRFQYRDFGERLMVKLTSGAEFIVVTGARKTPPGDLAIMPILWSDDREEAARGFVAAGLTTRVVAERTDGFHC